MNKKVILMILDGWGITQDPKVSAIFNAKTSYIDSLYNKYANASLRTDGEHVGLPEGQMGNSEVGHMNLGAGRIVYQDLAKINLAIEKDTLKDEKVLIDALKYASDNNKNVHFLGLLSNGGVHAHTSHLKGFIDANRLQKGLDRVSIEDAWHSVMGNAISKYTTAIKLDRDVLYIQLSSSVLREELSHGKSKIIAMINEELQREVIKDVVLR
mgnify:CR=1 FL=1